MDVRFVIRSPSGKRRNGGAPLPVLVGRGEEAKIRIPQDSVSRRHCEFVERDGRVCIRDLGSTNGTLLDGRRIEANVDTPVSSGGTVTVGNVEIRVEYTPPRAGYDDRTILLKSLPEVAATEADRPNRIEVGAAGDETQADGGAAPDLEPEEAAVMAQADDQPTEFMPIAAAAGEAADVGPEPAPDTDDFAFLSASASAEPAGEKAEPAPEAEAVVAPAKPAARAPAKPAEKAAPKPAAKVPAKPAAKAPAKPAATSSEKKPAAKPAPQASPQQPAADPAGDFGFLDGAGTAAPVEDVPGWPAAADEPPPVDEDDLNDFFKSLS